MLYMVTFTINISIYPSHVSIYTSTMDPSWVWNYGLEQSGKIVWRNEIQTLVKRAWKHQNLYWSNWITGKNASRGGGSFPIGCQKYWFGYDVPSVFCLCVLFACQTLFQWLSHIIIILKLIINWLVFSTPLENMSSSVGIIFFPTEWKVIKFMFQTTNQ